MFNINEKEDAIYDFIVENGFASEETLQIIAKMNGYSVETLNRVIYVTTGYHSMQQYIECEYL